MGAGWASHNLKRFAVPVQLPFLRLPGPLGQVILLDHCIGFPPLLLLLPLRELLDFLACLQIALVHLPSKCIFFPNYKPLPKWNHCLKQSETKLDNKSARVCPKCFKRSTRNACSRFGCPAWCFFWGDSHAYGLRLIGSSNASYLNRIIVDDWIIVETHQDGSRWNCRRLDPCRRLDIVDKLDHCRRLDQDYEIYDFKHSDHCRRLDYRSLTFSSNKFNIHYIHYILSLGVVHFSSAIVERARLRLN